jgi:ADP-heptose:LPS heptosyltransferase
MKIGIYLSYVGLGANLLHLSYCHQIAKKHGPVTIITLCKNLEDALLDDPLIKKVYYLNKHHKKFKDVFKLGKVLKEYEFDNLLIFYPSLRIYFAAKIAGIKSVRTYNIFKKKNLHLVHTAKKFTEKILKIKDCPTETNFYINKKNLLKRDDKNKNSFKIVIGAGSSGPTTRWGSKNFSNLINELNKIGNYYFYILCGPNEKEIESEIVANLDYNNFETLSEKKIKELIPYLCSSDMYIGNDSFGSHITSQSGKKSIVILLDSPRAYTDYSKNYYRVIPKGFDINKLTHGSNADPNLVSVDEIINIVKKFKD